MTSWNIKKIVDNSVIIRSDKVSVHFWFNADGTLIDYAKYSRYTYKGLGGRYAKEALSLARVAFGIRKPKLIQITA